jgi:hypothetical protein
MGKSLTILLIESGKWWLGIDGFAMGCLLLVFASSISSFSFSSRPNTTLKTGFRSGGDWKLHFSSDLIDSFMA